VAYLTANRSEGKLNFKKLQQFTREKQNKTMMAQQF